MCREEAVAWRQVVHLPLGQYRTQLETANFGSMLSCSLSLDFGIDSLDVAINSLLVRLEFGFVDGVLYF